MFTVSFIIAVIADISHEETVTNIVSKQVSKTYIYTVQNVKNGH